MPCMGHVLYLWTGVYVLLRSGSELPAFASMSVRSPFLIFRKNGYCLPVLSVDNL